MMWLTWGNIAPLLAGASLSHGFIQAMKAGTEFAYQLTFVKALGGETAESVRGIGNAALELSKMVYSVLWNLPMVCARCRKQACPLRSR